MGNLLLLLLLPPMATATVQQLQRQRHHRQQYRPTTTIRMPNTTMLHRLRTLPRDTDLPILLRDMDLLAVIQAIHTEILLRLETILHTYRRMITIHTQSTTTTRRRYRLHPPQPHHRPRMLLLRDIIPTEILLRPETILRMYRPTTMIRMQSTTTTRRHQAQELHLQPQLLLHRPMVLLRDTADTEAMQETALRIHRPMTTIRMPNTTTLHLQLQRQHQWPHRRPSKTTVSPRDFTTAVEEPVLPATTHTHRLRWVRWSERRHRHRKKNTFRSRFRTAS